MEDYPGPLRKSEGVSTDWGSWWEDVEARNEGDLKSWGIPEDLGLLHTSMADGGGYFYWCGMGEVKVIEEVQQG